MSEVAPTGRNALPSITRSSFAWHSSDSSPDLVEEQRAFVGLLEEAGVVAVGAAEGPLLVAEQFGLEQRRGDGGAVDDDERALRAAAVAVQRQRHQFLARAALALHEHGERLRGGLQDLLAQVDDRRAAADDVVGGGGVDAEPRVLGFERAAVAVDFQPVREDTRRLPR